MLGRLVDIEELAMNASLDAEIETVFQPPSCFPKAHGSPLW